MINVLAILVGTHMLVGPVAWAYVRGIVASAGHQAYAGGPVPNHHLCVFVPPVVGDEDEYTVADAYRLGWIVGMDLG